MPRRIDADLMTADIQRYLCAKLPVLRGENVR